MKAAFYTLGCKVNQYETEAMKEQFSRAGYGIAGENEPADVYVINTCTVTGLADRKSRQYIRRAKRLNPASTVAVTGCYAQMSPEEARSIEGVDVIAGTNEKHNLLKYIENYRRSGIRELHIRPYEELQGYEPLGVIKSVESRTRAYIKIQEGCGRFCSYCVIPYARGRSRSRDPEEIITEAENLINKGFKEIILTGVNTALYGADLGYGGIEPLIARLDALDGDFRIRLSSLEPTVIDAAYVKSLLGYKRLCCHLHLSLQSGSDRVLKLMNRNYDREGYLEIVRTLRGADPLYGITTDIIAGFPGEREEDFRDSLRMVREAGFHRIHVFKFSPRKGTKAAEMEDRIPEEVKNARSRRLIKAGEKAASDFFRLCLGSRRTVLFEKTDEGGMITGYADNYVRVYVKGDDKMLNRFYDVKLLKEYKDGMKGEIVNG